MTGVTEPILLNLADAAELVSCSTGRLRRAIHATDPHGDPPHLPAKRKGNRFQVRYTDLLAWADSLPEA